MKRDVVNCLRCHVPMRFLGDEKIQLGKAGWITGDLPHLFSGALDVAVFTCPVCGKLEFFNRTEATVEMPRKICPECGAEHDANGSCCPVCGYTIAK